MKIHIGKSKLHGKGLFAKKDIKKGEIVFIIKGKKIKFLINSQAKAKIAGFNWVGIGKNEWRDPNKHCVYFNHSCDANTAILGHVTVIALRNIKKGEEVTFDYSTTEADIFWQIRCHCKEKNCRKTIKSIQFLPEKDYKHYMPYIPIYFQKVYNKFRYSRFKNYDKFKREWLLYLSA
ncbi:MAG: SET domain-containing protein [Patescibacteria group bacterium]